MQVPGTTLAQMSPEGRVFAHTVPDQSEDHWELLSTHLDEVADLVAEFSESFNAQDWGYVLGAWHDLGKYSHAFQAYLRKSHDIDAGEEDQTAGRVDHSTYGAQHALKVWPFPWNLILAFCIAGHHSGLPDAAANDDQRERATLQWRLAAGPPRVPAVDLPPDFSRPSPPRLPLTRADGEVGIQTAFFVRMLFSCLIDADRTATERFCDNPKSIERNRSKPAIAQLAERLDAFLDRKKSANPSVVNQLRAQVLADCRSAADQTPGFFALNVPTGGGKTLSSLAFAFRHSLKHDLRRVVVAIPFTSIIEQTADVYRDALGDLAALGLVEHHSNIDPPKHTRQNQMAAENWDAPLVVTTNVQLFESLFAAGTTPCRKLHRLARSVIVLDEAQTIPIELLTATLAALKALVRDYGCTIVLCTATQPALEKTADFKIGIDPTAIRNIIPPDRDLHASLKRVTVMLAGKLADDELANRLAAERAVLCIVNTRPHAAKLFDAMTARIGEKGCYHLSTLMCAQHRRDVLAEIRQRLKDQKPCRVISTQLIEAGVDVDFPCVYRAATGFDSIAQAAGRCNREGRLDVGRVYVFDADQLPPAGLLRRAADAARELAPSHPDPLAPTAVNSYFRHLYWMQKDVWDRYEVMPCFSWDAGHQKSLPFQFRTAAERYKIIRDEQASILVPYNTEAQSLLSRLLAGAPADFEMLRQAQRYTVGVRDLWLQKLAEARVITPHDSGLWLLANPAAYIPKKGMSFDEVGFDPNLLIP